MTERLHLHAEACGGGHAPWLVFLHGFLGDSGDWSDAAQTLESQCSILCVDLPGHGESRIERVCSPEEILDGLGALLDSHRIERCVLAGYSMGGRLALSMASHKPDRIERLILESASRGLRTQEERLARHAADARWIKLLEEGDMAVFLEHWYAQPLFDSLHRDPARFDGLIRRRARQDPRQLALALQSMGPSVWPPAWESWPSLDMPLLLMAGERDSKYVVSNRKMAAQNPHAQLRLMPNCGHNVHWEDCPAYTAAIRTFLKDP